MSFVSDPTRKVKENGDSSNHSTIFESPNNPTEPSDNSLVGIKSPEKQMGESCTNNSNGGENTEVSDDNIFSGEQKKPDVLTEARDDGDVKSSRSYEDDFEDDVEEECSISIGDSTDDESVRNESEKTKDNF